MTQDTNIDHEGPRAFGVFLRDLGYGDAHRELSEELNRVIANAQDEALAVNAPVSCSLQLTVRFKVDPGGYAAAAYEIKRKDPSRKTSASVFFVTKGGNLTQENPRQTSLPLREVNERHTPARTIQDDPEVRNV